MIHKHGIVNRAKNKLFCYQAWPSVCIDENGVLYAVCSGFRMQHVCPWGKTVMYKSYNGGETWTPPMVIHDSFLDDRDAGIVYMGNGKMLVTWFTDPAKVSLHNDFDDMKRRCDRREIMPTMGMVSSFVHLNEEEGKGGSFVMMSDDYGVTWSEPVRIPVTSPHGPAYLKDGSLLYLGREFHSEGNELSQFEIAAYKSTDGGYTWNYTGSVKTPDGVEPRQLCEPHVIELPSGRLFGAVRFSNYSVRPMVYSFYFTYSDDGGKTWSDPVYSGADGTPPHFMLHSSGALVCSFGKRSEPCGERAIVSYDGGETWDKEISIFDNASDPDLGYPCSVELPDGKILTVYYQRYEDDWKPSILYTIWSLD